MPVKRVYPVPSDIEIAQMAELIPIVEIAAKVGLSEDDLDPLRQVEGQGPPGTSCTG
jgi:hypothetical protein